MRLLLSLLFALTCAVLVPACGAAPETPADREGARDRAAEQDRDLQRKLDQKRAND